MDINKGMESLIERMREVLGTAYVLYTATHGFHWNVEGSDFYQLHKLLQDQYEDIWASLDGHAEQIRALDAYTPQSVVRMLELSRVGEPPPAPMSGRDMMLFLVDANEVLIDLMNEALALAAEENQQGLANFLGGRIEAHQKHRWMLRATAKTV